MGKFICRRQGFRIFLYFLSVVTFSLAIATSILVNHPNALSDILSNHTFSEIIEVHARRLGPYGYDIEILWCILAMHLIVLIYWIFIIARHHAPSPYQSSVELLPAATLLFYALSFACLNAWLIMFDRRDWLISSILSFIQLLTWLVTIATLMKAFHHSQAELSRSSNIKHIVMSILALNIIGVSLAWSLFVCIRNITITVLANTDELSEESGIVCAISIMQILVLCHALLDHIVLEESSRYLLSPYLTWLVLISLIIVEPVMPLDKSLLRVVNVVKFSFLVELAILFVFKLVRIIKKSRSDPIYSRSSFTEPKRDYNMVPVYN